MQTHDREWLPHLEDSITQSASITGVSLYTIALEGWRRGLQLEFYSDSDRGERKRIKYTLADGEKKHFFNDSSGDLNTKQAIKICGDKGLTQHYLQKNNVPIPLGKEFNENHSIEEMIQFARTLTYPLVVKPVDGFGGTGVIVNIKDEKELKDSIIHVKNKLNFNRIIIQEFIQGEEIRIYVLNNKVLAAANRVPAHIVGDGKRTILSLIHEKNNDRMKNPNLKHRLIRLDAALNEYLEALGYSLDTVLAKDQYLALREISNVSLGGEPVDYTDSLTEEQIKIAESATSSVPGLVQCGVDMIINQKENRNVILELNASPGIGTHLFPVHGKARDIPKHVIDFYFPNSKQYNKNEQLLYFDLDSVLDPLLSGQLKKVEVPNYPKHSVHTTKFIILVRNNVKDTISKLYETAQAFNFNGYIANTYDGHNEQIELVINHFKEEFIEKFKNFITDLALSGKILEYKTEPYKQPIKIGFHYRKDINSVSELEFTHRQTYREYSSLNREVQRMNKRIKKVKNSRFWKLTLPMRKLGELFQK